MEEEVLEEANERLGHRWEDNINAGRKLMGYAGVDRIRLAQRPVTGSCVHVHRWATS